MNNNINKLRKEKGLTIRELAILSNRTELTLLNTIHNKTNPSKKTKILISMALNSNIDEVFPLTKAT